MSTFNHPERQPGEHFLINATPAWISKLPYPHRVGTTAYTRDGAPRTSKVALLPVFVDSVQHWHRLKEKHAKTVAACEERGLPVKDEGVRAAIATVEAEILQDSGLVPFYASQAKVVLSTLSAATLRRVCEVPGFRRITICDGELALMFVRPGLAPKQPEPPTRTEQVLLMIDPVLLTPEARAQWEAIKERKAACDEWQRKYVDTENQKLREDVKRALEGRKA